MARPVHQPAPNGMSAPQEMLAIRLLRWLARMVHTYPRVFFYPQLLLFIVCLVYTFYGLKTDFSRNNLVGPNKRYHELFLQYKEEFASQDDLVVMVESNDLEKNRQFVERLGAKLENEPALFADVFYKGDLKMMGSKSLLFLSESDLQELRQTLRTYRPFVQQFTQATNLVALFSQINRQFYSARPEQNAETESMIKALPALERIILQATDSLRRPGTPVSPGVNALFDGGQEAESRMYITFAEGRFYLVTARAASASVLEKAVARLRELVAQTQREVPGLNVGATGAPLIEMDEMAQTEKDISKATVISFALVFLIIVYGYGKVSRRIKADLCLIVGMVYTMAFTTLVIGHLNILTVTFAPILIGLAIDFGVHLIARYEEELQHGRSARQAMEQAMVVTGMGIVTGGLTTAGAFLAMGATGFRGIQEMGIICGGGLIICLVPMLTLLPVLLLRESEASLRESIQPHAGPDRRAEIEQLWLRRPVPVLLLMLVLSAAAAFQYRKVGFDYNLLHLQSASAPAVVCEKKLIHSTSKSVLFGAVIATNLDHAAALEARLQNLPSVASVESLVPFLRDDSPTKLALVGEVKREVADIRFAEPDTEPVEVEELSRTLWSLQGFLGLAIKATTNDEPALAGQLRSLRVAITDLRKTMLDDPQLTASKLLLYQKAFFQDIRDTFHILQTQDNSSRLTVEDLPLSLRHRFVGKSGKILLQVYPKHNVWERDQQEIFVRELRSVDPLVTGEPVQLYEYTALLKDSYVQATGYSLIAIVILVFLHFRSFLCVLLALFPVGVGYLWMVGLMSLGKIDFNPANIMTLPLVVGIGITNGIHILNRFAEERTPSILARSTGKAVIVSGLTTIVGFGSLVISSHQGIASLGLIMSFGVGTCMVAGLSFLPALITLLTRCGWTIKKPSADNAPSALGLEEL